MHAQVARAKRNRRRVGAPWYSDQMPLQPARDALARMRSAGMTWDQIAVLAGTERRSLQRVNSLDRSYVTRYLHDRIHEAAKVLDTSAAPSSVNAVLVPSDRAKWMVGSLLAMGWTGSMIGEAVGWKTKVGTSDFNPKIHIDTQQRIEEFFLDHYWKWGPSRAVAVGQWRRGRFPADCYEWDGPYPDYRPIPGSLHPDLVAEASRFVPASRARTERVLADMRRWGQWPDARCARTSMRNWAEAVGAAVDEYQDVYVHPGRSVWCRIPSHDHSLPECWKE